MIKKSNLVVGARYLHSADIGGHIAGPVELIYLGDNALSMHAFRLVASPAQSRAMSAQQRQQVILLLADPDLARISYTGKYSEDEEAGRACV